MGAQVVNSDQTAFAHVGKSRYAHAAHKGVVHVPHARRKAASCVDASQAAAASQQDGAAAVTLQPSRGAAISNTGGVPSQALFTEIPSATPETQLAVPLEPPPAGSLPSSFGSLQ